MHFKSSDKNSATHVQILNTDDNKYAAKHGLNLLKVYEIEYSKMSDSFGEMMIQGEDGVYWMDFELALDVKWLVKEDYK